MNDTERKFVEQTALGIARALKSVGWWTEKSGLIVHLKATDQVNVPHTISIYPSIVWSLKDQEPKLWVELYSTHRSVKTRTIKRRLEADDLKGKPEYDKMADIYFKAASAACDMLMRSALRQ